MFYDNFIKLCQENHISPTTLLTDYLKMSGGNLTKWRDGKVPKSDTLQKIANHFGVSIDKLLGNEQKNKPSTEVESLSSESIAIAREIEQLAPDTRAKLQELISLYRAAQDKTL